MSFAILQYYTLYPEILLTTEKVFPQTKKYSQKHGYYNITLRVKP
eukprot:UN17976